MPRKREIQRVSKTLLGSIVVSILAVGCASNPPPSDCSWQMWMGRPNVSGIVRTNEDKTLPCSDPAFKDYVCFSKESFENFLTCGEGD
jgi:hypothetical protein